MEGRLSEVKKIARSGLRIVEAAQDPWPVTLQRPSADVDHLRPVTPPKRARFLRGLDRLLPTIELSFKSKAVTMNLRTGVAYVNAYWARHLARIQQRVSPPLAHRSCPTFGTRAAHSRTDG